MRINDLRWAVVIVMCAALCWYFVAKADLPAPSRAEQAVGMPPWERLAVVTAVAGLAVASGPDSRAQEQAVPAVQLAEALRVGTAVDLQEAVVDGDLDLTGGEIAAPLRCRRCHFRGALRARDVTFQRMVDLSGSEVDGPVDLVGARFEQPTLFARSGDVRAVFNGPVVATQASFEDQAAFDGADFRDTVDFSATRFAGQTSVAGARFSRRADFVGTSMHRAFDATVVQFAAEADFTRVDLLGGALFIGATFVQRADFDFARVEGSLDASGAAFFGRTSLTHVSSTGTLRLVGASVRGPLLANDLAPRHIEMDLDDVGHIDADHRRAVLSLIEVDARERGAFATANEAHFELLRLNSRRLGGPARLLDVLVYRGVLGYLVRPGYPASLLALVVLAITAYRWAGRKPVAAQPAAGEPEPTRPPRTLACFLDQLQASVGRALSPKLRATAHGLGVLAAWGEYLGTKVLLAGVALGLANSNDTLRQLVEAIK